MTLSIQKIRTDGGTQPRAAIDYDAVDDYAELMEAGARFPKVTVFYDGSEYWLADGFHRIKAALQNSLEEIDCDVQQGTKEDAQWFSFSANKSHGLRRTNEDKQRAVQAALAHPHALKLSDSKIAKHVGVDHKTVAAWREKLIGDLGIPKSTKRTGQDGRTINTGNIGKRPAPAQPSRRVESDELPVATRSEQGAIQVRVSAPVAVAPEDSSIELGALWARRIVEAVRIIGQCPLTSTDIAGHLGTSEFQLMERVSEFIREVAAENPDYTSAA